MKRTLFLLLIQAVFALPSHAQYDDEYRWEIGVGAGTMAYEGDFNGNILKNWQPAVRAVLRRVINPYMDVALNVSYGKLAGNPADVETHYPDAEQLKKFSNPCVDAGVRYEYNFWPYGTGLDYRGAKRLTPFVFGGVGLTYASTDEKSLVTANVPLGLGVKLKVATRLNLGLEWGVHFTFSDKLDGVADPYGVKSTGLFKNTDCYSALSVTLTYSFAPKCKTCNNDRDD